MTQKLQHWLESRDCNGGRWRFRDLIRRVRAGDGQAAAELVRRYEKPIRRAVRVRLDPAMRRVLDSMDICQSVLANFFMRAAAGQFELDRPEQLLALLVTMARNRLKDHKKAERAACRDQRRIQHDAVAESKLVQPGAGPSTIVADRELLDEFRRRLTPEERALADARAEGRSWDEIAAQLGKRADALRMRLHRAGDRIAKELGLDPLDE